VTTPPPPYAPHTRLVARGWLELALPTEVVDALPPADKVTAKMRELGLVRVRPLSGQPSIENPMRHPVVTAECWVPPPQVGSSIVQTNAAERLGGWVVAATQDLALMGRLVDLTAFGTYRPARVHTVVALTEPVLVEGDPNKYARTDVDLHFHWSAPTP
jgi:hypothetical protein